MRGSHLPLFPGWRLWAIAAAVAMVDLAWLSVSVVTIDWGMFALTAVVGGVCLGWFCLGRLIPLRDGPRILAAGLAFILIAGRPLAIFSHLLMTTPFPLADGLLARWDAALGLDWVEYLSWVAARPWAATGLYWVYFAFFPATLLTFIVLHALGRHDRAAEYLGLTFAAGLVAVTVGSAFPAMGAPEYYHAPERLMAALPGIAQWGRQLTELRSGLPIEIMETVGLVSFPSYHVALAAIVAWSLRGVPIAFPLAVAYAVGTTASAPIIGGHYFVDLLGGLAVVALLIAIRTLLRRRPVTAPAAAQ